MNDTHDEKTSAENLDGLTLEGQNGKSWEVVARLVPGPTATGSYFSVSYAVQDQEGQAAFLKAIDIERALRRATPGSLLTIRNLIDDYERERSLLEKCLSMSRVVSILDHGIHQPDGQIPVPFLVFEQADTDIRGFLSKFDYGDYSTTLHLLHQAAVGLKQLHNSYIAHQDVKPSNVLVFDGDSGKIGDLGRASERGVSAWWDDVTIPGAHAYAAPELRYGFVAEDWLQRRILADYYQLGSLIVFMVDGVSMNGLLEAQLAPEHHWTNWGGTYGDVLPVLADAYAEVLERLSATVPDELGELVEIVGFLCDPDLARRGRHGGTAKLSVRTIDWYISRLNRLAIEADIRRTSK